MANTNKNTEQTFIVSAKIVVDVNLPVVANDLSEAGKKAESLQSTDFIEILGELNHIEGPNIWSIYKS